MNLRECYKVLGLEPGVDMATVKRAYRRLAFSLHPDLNPDVPDASRRFQQVNEAYVQLSQAAVDSKARREASARAGQEGPDSAKAREEASRAYNKARQGQAAGKTGTKQKAERQQEDVLKDILNDPFARRVFEDIYSHIRKDDPGKREQPGTQTGQGKNSTQKPSARTAASTPTPGSAVMGKVKGWLRKQIDDEQVVRLPGASLVPGARVRLEIQHGLGGAPQVVELTLPPEFVPGKAMRLKGMGRRLGSLRGDLYVRIEAT